MMPIDPAASVATLDAYLEVAVVDDGKRLADPIFQRRYRQDAPDFPYHVVGFYRPPGGPVQAACYIHFTALGDCLLGGGACVDDRVLRRMAAPAREALHRAGGLYRHCLAWSVRHFAPLYPAIFGYCGDVLAERADLAVGFERTAHPHLLVYFTRPLPAETRARLIAEAHTVGPF